MNKNIREFCYGGAIKIPVPTQFSVKLLTNISSCGCSAFEHNHKTGRCKYEKEGCCKIWIKENTTTWERMGVVLQKTVPDWTVSIALTLLLISLFAVITTENINIYK